MTAGGREAAVALATGQAGRVVAALILLAGGVGSALAIEPAPVAAPAADSAAAAPSSAAPSSDLPSSSAASLSTTGEPWTITGDHLQGGRTGVSRLLAPRAEQRGISVTGAEGIWHRTDEILNLSGGVVLKDSVRTITSRLATYDRRRSLVILTGEVRGSGPEGKIAARELHYWREAGRLELRDSVRLEDDARILEASRVVYDTRADRGRATGDVVLLDLTDSTRITGQQCDLDRVADRAVVTGSPVLTRPDAWGEEQLRASADTLEMRSGESIGSARGNVRILRGAVEASGGSADLDFNRDLLRLRDGPVVVDPDGEVTGDSMAILLARGRAERLEVLGRARVHYSPRAKPGEHNLVLGDTLIGRLDSLGVREIRIWGNGRSLYLPSPEDRRQKVGANVSRGGSIRISVESGEARRVDLWGNASGEYVPPRAKPDTTSARLSDSLFAEAAILSFLASSDRTAPDSLELDGPFDAGERVIYQGDSIAFHVPEKRIEMRGHGIVRYKDLELSSAEIDYSAKRDRVVALGEPTLKDPTSALVGSRMVYRLDRKHGFVYQGKTEFEGGFYYGEEIKRVDEKILLVRSGDYTTCDADTSHYHFHSRRMKIRIADKVVARPIVLYLKDIPLLALPYWVFPIRKGRHSGMLMPDVEFGFDRTRGRFVRNLGYYFAPNDYIDAMAWGDYYEQSPRFIMNGQVRYKLRYRLGGSLFTSYSKQETYAGSRARWDLRANHDQELGERLSLRLHADFVSDASYRDDREFGGSVDERLNRILKSNVDLRKSWSSTSLSVTADRTENLDRATSTMQLQQSIPSVDFSVNSFAIGRKADERGKGGRLPSLATLYTRFGASFRSVFEKKWGEPTRDGQAARIATGLTDNRSIGPYLKLSPSLSATGAWFRRDFRGRSHGFGGVWDGGASARSTLYGTFPVGIGPVLALRHVVEPSLSYRYAPEIAYLRVADSTGRKVARFPSVGGIALSGSRASSMSLSLTQRFHFKLAGEDPRKPRKIDNLILWTTSTSYNFLEQGRGKRPFSTLSNSLRVQPSRYIDNSWSVSHDPYTKALRSLSVQTNFRLTGGGGGADTTGSTPAAYGEFGQAGGGRSRPGEKRMGASGPWSLNLAHSYSRGQRRSSESSTMNISTSVMPTAGWRATYSVYCDLRRREIRSQAFSLYRDLHCWEASLDRRIAGDDAQYYFRINVKDLPDVQYERQRR